MKNKISISYFFLLILITACTSSALFNQRTYEESLMLKEKTLVLMDKAGQDYSLFTDEVLQLKLKINKTYDYVKGLPDNDETTAQWEIIKDPGRNSVAGFLEKWKAEGKLNPVFIKNAKRIITDHFNRVIELERGKRR